MASAAAGFDTRSAGGAPDATAPDGSEVRLLCGLARGRLALFTLPPGAVARPVTHRTVEELWYVVSGKGRIWRRLGPQDEVAELLPGVSISLPVATHFQFRCDGLEPLVVLGATIPPWPDDDEAYRVDGVWHATV